MAKQRCSDKCGEPLQDLIRNDEAYPTNHRNQQKTESRKRRNTQSNPTWAIHDHNVHENENIGPGWIWELIPGKNKVRKAAGHATNAQHPESQLPPVGERCLLPLSVVLKQSYHRMHWG